jgi:hypothetical protein
LILVLSGLHTVNAPLPSRQPGTQTLCTIVPANYSSTLLKKTSVVLVR